MADIQLEESWKAALADEFTSSYMQQLKQFLLDRKAQNAVIFPAGSNYFRALDLTPLDNVKVVILGQDPYHGPGQAHGLSFSVRPGVRIPPSLINIYKEIERDLGIAPARHGFLEDWAKQGVLLLNSVLTVEQGQAGAHQGKGWEQFTDAVIRQVNEQDKPSVFMLWGSYAQKKASFIDRNRHLVLKAPHPSPLSAHRGFLGCGHFSKANAFLADQGSQPINWQLPDQVETS
ncbi:uracil-DNA glycosylase [Maritalea mediterranea]|uniref:Uracil-DNA glycosylase n=1 Tax=Maritalea mediterranea TaxID=2909667 RepID=A0ABS9E469_9HYPH|nr:uracil-DNA glycosylase [Maritalea mediterranea]MCF4097673.1 uracil-DNA glycosylase [Maritalea mediterranea]